MPESCFAELPAKSGGGWGKAASGTLLTCCLMIFILFIPKVPPSKSFLMSSVLAIRMASVMFLVKSFCISMVDALRFWFFFFFFIILTKNVSGAWEDKDVP